MKPYDPKDGVHYNYYTTTKGILEKENPDIRVDYEDHFEELQSLSIILKKDIIRPEELIAFIIRVLRSYGKKIELIYKEEKEFSY